MERVKEAGTPNLVGQEVSHGSGSGTREIDAASSHLSALAATTKPRGAEPRAVREKAPRKLRLKNGFSMGLLYVRVILI
jgi:hypothetical protein